MRGVSSVNPSAASNLNQFDQAAWLIASKNCDNSFSTAAFTDIDNVNFP